MSSKDRAQREALFPLHLYVCFLFLSLSTVLVHYSELCFVPDFNGSPSNTLPLIMIFFPRSYTKRLLSMEGVLFDVQFAKLI